MPVARIAAATRHLARAREALEAATEALLDRHARFDDQGHVLLDFGAVRREPREIGLRAFAAVLKRVSRKDYRPRFERLERAYAALCEGNPPRGLTLAGCRVAFAPKACAKTWSGNAAHPARDGAEKRPPWHGSCPLPDTDLAGHSPKKGHNVPIGCNS